MQHQCTEGEKMLIWRGWGLIALFTLVPLMATCAGLTDVKPFWIFSVAVAASFLFAGAVCVQCGTRWNRNGTEHSFYFIPLQIWGWIYLIVFALFAASSAVGGAVQLVRPIPGPPDPTRPEPKYLAAAGVLGLVIFFATSWLTVWSTRPRKQIITELDAERAGME